VSEAQDSQPFPLTMADEGVALRIVALRAGRGLDLRLTELGLNVGSELRVVQRRGGGIIVARGQARIAIGGGMATKVMVVRA
jgi:ferrous iron transport protein A